MVDPDITMSIDETLELDTIIKKSNEATNQINISDGIESTDFNLEGIQKHIGIFDPINSGTYNMDLNGQKLTIKVKDTNTIPKSELLHRYDATSLSGYDDGDKVSTWEDLSGSADLTAGTAPKYKNGIINNNPVVRFNGIDSYLDVLFNDVSQPYHIFMVLQWTIDDGNNSYIFDGADKKSYYSASDNNQSNSWRIDAGSSLKAGSLDNNVHIHSLLYNTNNSIIRQDGSQIGTGDVGSNSLSGITVGGTRQQQSQFGEADVGEILIYDEVKSGSELSKIESVLSDKWGIEI